jgi:ABC-2 type transport system ATP-binding protein
MATDSLIDIRQLSKRYGRSSSLALDRLSLQVAAGEVYGFLGANGAGKTTTIRTLMGFIRPTGGSATIAGNDIVADSVAIKSRVGYLAGEIALYDRLTGQQFLDYMAKLQPPKDPALHRALVKRFAAQTHRPLGELSKGNRQKFGIIQAFMHEPDILVLDEPTSGLDPLMQDEFYAIVKEASQRGAAIFVSSHNFAEVERMCSKVGFIRGGKLVAEQSLAELANQAAHTFSLTFGDKAPMHELNKLDGASITSHDDHHVTVSVQGELSPLFGVLAHHHVTRLHQQDVNLEEEFLQFYRKDEHDK